MAGRTITDSESIYIAVDNPQDASDIFLNKDYIFLGAVDRNADGTNKNLLQFHMHANNEIPTPSEIPFPNIHMDCIKFDSDGEEEKEKSQIILLPNKMELQAQVDADFETVMKLDSGYGFLFTESNTGEDTGKGFEINVKTNSEIEEKYGEIGINALSFSYDGDSDTVEPFMATEPSHVATKAYVDSQSGGGDCCEELKKRVDILEATLAQQVELNKLQQESLTELQSALRESNDFIHSATNAYYHGAPRWINLGDFVDNLNRSGDILQHWTPKQPK